jgi:glutamine synthetase
LHWSIWDTGHTTNKLADPNGQAGLSTLARQAIAGVLTHLPGLLALTTPSVNSFRRLQPHYWSSAYTAWGIENREAAVRVPTRYWDDEEASTNLELKASDASANPFISLGGVIAAAIDGIERGLDPGDPVNEDPGNLSDADREQRGIRRFPLTASEALDELERDPVLTRALGDGLATEYLKVRRAEAAAYAEHDEAYELDQHFLKY